ncbi:MAG: hypothetical protein ACK4MF_04415 [Hyphomicrobiaceae bacterium]
MALAALAPAARAGHLAPPLMLAPGASLDIACDTKSVLVATDAANASNGALILRLMRAAEPEASKGTWRILSVSDGHKASLGTLQAQACASGCPLAFGQNDVQLWSPAPKSVQELGPQELLLLAVVKLATLDLKASTFRGQQIEALESGACRAAAMPNATPDQATETTK